MMGEPFSPDHRFIVTWNEPSGLVRPTTSPSRVYQDRDRGL